MYSCFGLSVDAAEICPRNRPWLCNSIHNSFHKHNMEATVSHMQTHGQIKEHGARGDRGHFELLAKPLTDWLSEWELVCDRPECTRSDCWRNLCYILQLESELVTANTHTNTVHQFLRPQFNSINRYSNTQVLCMLSICAATLTR